MSTNLTFDRNLFTQIGLDSASLTMLGTVVHSFPHPGVYRGVVHEGREVKAVFTLISDKNSANAQVSIDLASLVSDTTSEPKDKSCCGDTPSGKWASPTFVVNPRGYALFHVSEGSGGYSVQIRHTDAVEDDRGYDSRILAEGDVFTAIVLRPGVYRVANERTDARAELTVAYPDRNEKRYRPPAPVRVAVLAETFEPNKLRIDPGQGLLFECRTSSHIRIRLEKADDGPASSESSQSRGWTPNRLR